MSFGFSIGDLILLTDIARQTLDNARKACGAHDGLTREVNSLLIVLRRLQVEISKPDSILNNTSDNRRNELGTIARDCRRVLNVLSRVLEKYNALSDEKRSVTKLWKQVRFGNGEMQDVAKMRSAVATYTQVITMFLNLLAMGELGEIGRYMESHGEELRDIKQSLHWVVATAQVRSGEEKSVLTTYTEDDKGVWREFRRELIREGFSSETLRKYKKTIQSYVLELGKRGALDELEASVDLSNTSGPDDNTVPASSSGLSDVPRDKGAPSTDVTMPEDDCCIEAEEPYATEGHTKDYHESHATDFSAEDSQGTSMAIQTDEIENVPDIKKRFFQSTVDSEQDADFLPGAHPNSFTEESERLELDCSSQTAAQSAATSLRQAPTRLSAREHPMHSVEILVADHAKLPPSRIEYGNHVESAPLAVLAGHIRCVVENNCAVPIIRGMHDKPTSGAQKRAREGSSQDDSDRDLSIMISCASDEDVQEHSNMTLKWTDHMEFAQLYMQETRKKAKARTRSPSPSRTSHIEDDYDMYPTWDHLKQTTISRPRKLSEMTADCGRSSSVDKDCGNANPPFITRRSYENNKTTDTELEVETQDADNASSSSESFGENWCSSQFPAEWLQRRSGMAHLLRHNEGLAFRKGQTPASLSALPASLTAFTMPNNFSQEGLCQPLHSTSEPPYCGVVMPALPRLWTGLKLDTETPNVNRTILREKDYEFLIFKQDSDFANNIAYQDAGANAKP
ncbi:hypothetical protein VTL71DRAFT_10932 [Oculimacula yallundae]|uniref:Fungal N-terminal domain-containing protein n=1 Tax=Oculimacula yallundae TaxID=86028 RepID=A0ABR4CWQ7_9HELO